MKRQDNYTVAFLGDCVLSDKTGEKLLDPIVEKIVMTRKKVEFCICKADGFSFAASRAVRRVQEKLGKECCRLHYMLFNEPTIEQRRRLEKVYDLVEVLDSDISASKEVFDIYGNLSSAKRGLSHSKNGVNTACIKNLVLKSNLLFGVQDDPIINFAKDNSIPVCELRYDMNW